LEEAEDGFREGYEEGFRERLERCVITRLFVWRGVEVPGSVARRLLETTDLAQLQKCRDRAYEITDPTALFREDDDRPPSR
jgi:hypothetical protein